MKYLKTFESFSPINEEGVFDTISSAYKSGKKKFLGDVIEDNLIKFASIFKKSKDEINKIVDQIKSEKDISKKNEILKELIGDWDDKNVYSKLVRIGVSVNKLRDELGCMTPEEKDKFDNRPGGSTGWEGSRGFH
jgi:hypothetical protein